MIILGLGLGHKWWRVALEKGADHLIHTGLRGCIKVCNAQQPSKDVPENNDCYICQKTFQIINNHTSVQGHGAML